MKVVFRTNLDKYRGNVFPVFDSSNGVPRVGEKVHVKKDLKTAFEYKKLPVRLEVVEVNYYEDQVVCELHYNDLDRRIYESAGYELF